MGTILVFLLIAGGNWLLAIGSPIFTVHIKQDALTDLVSSLFTAEASFLGLAFIVFVLLIERLAGHEYLDRPTFRRFMRKSWTDLLLAASMTLLVLTGFVLHWVSFGTEVTTADLSLLLGLAILLISLVFWVVVVAFTGIDFATPGQIFINLKDELKSIIDREIRLEQRARKANSKLGKVIESYEGDPAPTSPLVFQERNVPVYFEEGGKELSIQTVSHDRVVYDVNLWRLDTIMDRLIGDNLFPNIKVILVLKIGEVLRNKDGQEKITIGYASKDVYEEINSEVKEMFKFRSIPPLRIRDGLESVEIMALQAIIDGNNRNLKKSLGQIEDLQAKAILFRNENLSSFQRSASSASPNSSVNEELRDVLSETVETTIKKGGERSIPVVMQTWGKIVRNAAKQQDEEVLSIHTHIINDWVVLARQQAGYRHEHFGNELAEAWGKIGNKLLFSLQKNLGEFEKYLDKQENKKIKSIQDEVRHFKYSIAQGWYVIRESIDEGNIERLSLVWDHCKNKLVGKQMLPIEKFKRQLLNTEKALKLGQEEKNIKNRKAKLEAGWEILKDLRSLHRTLRPAAVFYGLRRLRNGKLDSSRYEGLIHHIFHLRKTRHYKFAEDFRFAIEDVDRQGVVSEAFSRTGLKITEEMVEGYVLCALWSINPDSPPDSEDNSRAVRQLQKQAHEPSGVRPVIALPNRLVEIGSKFINQLNRERGPDMSAVLPDQVEQRLEILTDMYLSS